MNVISLERNDRWNENINPYNTPSNSNKLIPLLNSIKVKEITNKLGFTTNQTFIKTIVVTIIVYVILKILIILSGFNIIWLSDKIDKLMGNSVLYYFGSLYLTIIVLMNYGMISGIYFNLKSHFLKFSL